MLHCHDQNDFCIKMGSNENHFNVSLIVRDTGHKLFEEMGEPKRNRAQALLLTSLTSYRWAEPAHRLFLDSYHSYNSMFT